jgi:hypothetical protein
MLHQVGDLFELDINHRCQKVNSTSKPLKASPEKTHILSYDTFVAK